LLVGLNVFLCGAALAVLALVGKPDDMPSALLSTLVGIAAANAAACLAYESGSGPHCVFVDYLGSGTPDPGGPEARKLMFRVRATGKRAADMELFLVDVWLDSRPAHVMCDVIGSNGTLCKPDDVTLPGAFSIQLRPLSQPTVIDYRSLSLRIRLEHTWPAASKTHTFDVELVVPFPFSQEPTL